MTLYEIGEAIAQQRKHLELGQGELADQAGISRGTLSAIENGLNPGASIGTILELAQLLNFDFELAEHTTPTLDEILQHRGPEQ